MTTRTKSGLEYGQDVDLQNCLSEYRPGIDERDLLFELALLMGPLNRYTETAELAAARSGAQQLFYGLCDCIEAVTSGIRKSADEFNKKFDLYVAKGLLILMPRITKCAGWQTTYAVVMMELGELRDRQRQVQFFEVTVNSGLYGESDLFIAQHVAATIEDAEYSREGVTVCDPVNLY